MSNIVFSCCIPAKDPEDPKLKDLIRSIRAQDFQQDQIEIIVETRGDSESAKGMAIKQAKGEICAMFCADNKITLPYLFQMVIYNIQSASAVFPERYSYIKEDNSLNRYFSLIGGNDPVCYYLGKNDRSPYHPKLKKTTNYSPSYGCNGFFYRSELIKATNLDNYYPMDNALEVPGKFIAMNCSGIWHRTSDNLISFLKKRYRYARDLYSDRTDRRWKIIDTRQDIFRLLVFAWCTITVFPCLYVSFRGYGKVKDIAWFWHWPVCFGFLITYTILAIRNLFKHGALFQKRPSLSQHLAAA